MDAQIKKDRYQSLSKHFQACADLPEQGAHRYVRNLQATDPDLARELQSLLQHHVRDLEGATPPPQPKTILPPEKGTGTRVRRRRISAPAVILLTGGLTFVFFFGIRTWALSHLEGSLKQEAGRSLKVVMDLRVAALRQWATKLKDRAQKFTEDPAWIAQVAALAELAREPQGLKERLLSSPYYKTVSDKMLQLPPEFGDRGFVVISPSGVDLCSETEDIVGRVVAPAGAAYLRRVNLGEWIVSRPYPDRQFALGVTPDFKTPIMFVGGPVRDASRQIIAMAVYRFSPDRFYDFFTRTTIEFLAFDEKRLLLNNIQDIESLQDAGLIPDAPETGTAFRALLRDPGMDLRSGSRPFQPPENWPATLMGLSATQGIDGIDTEGHRDLRGQKVLAAWAWLPEWEMGFGAQMPEARVLTPMGPVKAAFDALLAVPPLVTLVLLIGIRFVQIRRRTHGESPFGSYVLERPIGKGGMAEVFLARHSYLKRPAAVKILSSAALGPDAIERFEREARLASRLAHPNTIQIFDYGETPDGRLYYAMEFVKGLNLAQLLTLESPLPVNRIIYLLRQIAGSLEEAHEFGLIHRDLKPSNIMVCSKGALGDLVKVLDFGIACSIDGVTEDITKSTNLVGTPVYIAPERIRSPLTLDPRSDIYSFGAVAFYLLTGRNVFEGPGTSELIYQVLSAPRPSPSRLRGEQIPAELEQLVLDCLSAEPESRPPDFRSVEERLKSVTTEDDWGQSEARIWWSANRDVVAKFIQSTS